VAVVVSDTSPIRALAALARLDLLSRLFEEVLIPPAVATELGRRGRLFAPIVVADIPNARVQAPGDLARVRDWGARLDLGEAEALALALDVDAEAILIDESRGRAVARQLGLTPIGVLGVLVRAKEQGHVDAVRPLIERLQTEVAFFVSPRLRDEVLRLAGESP